MFIALWWCLVVSSETSLEQHQFGLGSNEKLKVQLKQNFLKVVYALMHVQVCIFWSSWFWLVIWYLQLPRLWLQIISPAQDGGARISDVLAIHRPSLLISVVLREKPLEVIMASSWRFKAERKPVLGSQKTSLKMTLWSLIAVAEAFQCNGTEQVKFRNNPFFAHLTRLREILQVSGNVEAVVKCCKVPVKSKCLYGLGFPPPLSLSWFEWIFGLLLLFTVLFCLPL